jgi:hypothetical protein
MLKSACPQCIDFNIFTFEACRIHNLAMHWLSNLRLYREVVFELSMVTIDSDKVVCGGILAMTVAVLVSFRYIFTMKRSVHQLADSLTISYANIDAASSHSQTCGEV